MLKKKIDNNTKALFQISKEINKQTKVIASIGVSLLNAKVKKLEKTKKEFKELVEENPRKGVS